jgi:hypothetical protein
LWDGHSCVRCGRSLQGAARLERPYGRGRAQDSWTRAGVIRALHAFAFFRDETPTPEDWEERGLTQDRPSLVTVERLFGSFDAAVRAARLP